VKDPPSPSVGGIAIRYRRCRCAKIPSVMCIKIIYLFSKPNMIASKHIG